MTWQLFLLILVCYVACTAKYLTYLLKSTEVIQIWEYDKFFDNLHMTQCANCKDNSWIHGKCWQRFHPTFTNVFFQFSPRFLRFLAFFYLHVNVYYICVESPTTWTAELFVVADDRSTGDQILPRKSILVKDSDRGSRCKKTVSFRLMPDVRTIFYGKC